MRRFEFELALSASKTRSLYEGQARYILVASKQGKKLQLPAANFRDYVSAAGIYGHFTVEIDANNKLVALQKI
ncbi:MAG: DUF2835 domain-containing protein [Gammaproteobacteria bacterium]|nr:DUF2835 domain-containing protein [Gammaproteobacteria bacterium]MCP4981696.1 DUF2835 domain-containing protein [Gammaproteobacteria bacterium]